ncbi:MAG: hypothetical protein EOM67_03160, partial [Spirochaetia bacterium]|nr:hypothetical protein [Spirochaetia bacterium]
MIHHSYMIEDNQISKRQLGRLESLYSIGNGHIGFRGYHIDHSFVHQPSLFMNGFYETSKIIYGEDAFGFARWNQTMVPLPDIRSLHIFVNGRPVEVELNSITDYKRRLDFFTGVFSYSFHTVVESHIELTISVETLVSMKNKSIGGAKVVIESNQDVDISIIQTITYPQTEQELDDDPRKQTAQLQPLIGSDYTFYEKQGVCEGIGATFETHQSNLRVYVMSQNSYSSRLISCSSNHNPLSFPAITYNFHDTKLTFSTLFFYESTKEEGTIIGQEQLINKRNILKEYTLEQLIDEQRAHYTSFWETHDIVVGGNDEIQQALRLNMFQLHQSTGTDGKTSLSAKGLTGSGYEGHYFWDTEIYGMPFFTFSSPLTARSLISYRIKILDKARERAREMSQKGALYPWRTINGLEASAYFPAGTAQYHINADIAYSILQYIDVTKDYSILLEGASTVLFETARLYADLGFFNDDEFCIHQVTGPDEYSALVDNNTYTNAMVRHHFIGAATIYEYMKKEYKEDFLTITSSINLTDSEIEYWKKAAKQMRFPFDPTLGIHGQDERFLELERWNVQKKGEIKHPMLLHYHPLVIYRHQVIKQADTVLAMFLLSHEFPRYEIKRNFDYYRPLTTGDSSLSACVEGIVAFDCGYVDIGYEYLKTTILMDLLDLHHNTKEGLHTAAMGGSWMAIIYGIAGFRFIDGVAHFRPQLPKELDKISFTLVINGEPLKVTITNEVTTYTSNKEFPIYHRSSHLTIHGIISIATAPIIKGVIFDLDGVITSTDEYHYRAWKRLSDEHGWKFDKKLNQLLRGISREASLQVILEHNNVTLSSEEIKIATNKKNEWYKESLYELDEKDILPGIKEMLIDLEEKGIKTAVASASKNAQFILDRLNLSS